jgi:hypothetical protein
MLKAVAFVIFLGLGAVTASAQEESASLSGSVDSGVYTSPTGAFKIQVPVMPALGGTVRDTANVVTFHDAYGTQISVGAFRQDATQKWEMSTRGTKDYLVYFFTNFVLPDFRHFCPSTKIESAGFSGDLLDGALFTYILLPGGSMFQAPPSFVSPAEPPVAKRGNLIFVKNGYTFVVSIELYERIAFGPTYKKSPEEEDKILRGRLTDVLAKMAFAKDEAAK